MNKIQQLLTPPPNGVEYKKLQHVCQLKAGDRITKAIMKDDEKYPVIGGGTEPTGFYFDFNFENAVTISRAGSAGFVGFQKNKFWATDVCFVAIGKEILTKFVYYYLKSKQYDLQQHLYGASMPKLDKNYLWNLPIPIPPIPVQEEIVRILDAFTNLQTNLQTELELRKKQYKYYRDKLLCFEDIDGGGGLVEWLEMQEVFDIKNGYTPSKANAQYWTNGTIPWFRMEDIRLNGGILSDSIQHITKEAVKGKLFPADSIIVATTATIGEHALITVESLANQQFTFLSKKQTVGNKLNMKFFYYYMFIVDEWCKKHINASNFASVDMAAFRKLKIPIPPLEEQKRIVGILDKFDKLVNDISIGIPAEIEMRKKQYEYYRDSLLRFEGV